MRVISLDLDGSLVYRFSGTPKIHEWDEISLQLAYHYEQGIRSVIINWLEIEHIDTSSLQVVVRLMKFHDSDPGFEFFVVIKNPSHLKILKIFGFDKLLNIAPSELRALEMRKVVEELP